MFVWSFRMNKRELMIAAAGIVIFALLVFLLLARGGAFDSGKGRDTEDRPASSSAVLAASLSSSAADGEQRAAYIRSLGWEIEETPLSVREVVIPLEFDAEFAAYSELQSSQGFDLESLKGKRVKLYTYRVTNYPAGGDNAVANLLIRKGRVVGGDISQAREGGAVQAAAG